MDPTIPDYLYSFEVLARFGVLFSVLGLIWLAVGRMPGDRQARLALGGTLSAVLLIWFAAASYLGAQNSYWTPENLTVPTVQFGILVPIVLLLPLLLRSASVTRLIDAMPLSWLVGIQAYRSLGVIFLLLWWDGHLPWQFALPAGIGDVATGIAALFVAALLAKKAAYALSAAYAWCLFGIVDLVVAVSMGTLTSPGRLHLLSLEAPNLLITAYPLVMIPTFAVPLSIILHGLCLWKIRRLAGTQRAAVAASA